MMKRCWLHVGMHKTSSTSVQHHLAKIKDDLNWCILNVGGRANMGPAIHAMFVEDGSKCVWLMKRGHTAESIAMQGKSWRNELEQAIREFEGETCIISGESLTDNVFSEEAVVSLRNYLITLFDEIKVIGYVRPPAQYKNSRFQERIKHRTNRFVTEKINYRGKFEKFDKVFGQENVILRKFDPSTFPNHCAVADFCQQVGIKLPENVKVQRLNESLSRDACGILYAYRKFDSGLNADKHVIKEVNYLIRALQMMRGHKLAFSASIIKSALEHEKDDILWMENRLQESLFEQYDDSEDKINSEDDLLKISRSSCVDFIKSFESMFELHELAELYPKSDPVEPGEVAALLNNCRHLVRKKLEERREKKIQQRSAGDVLRSRLKRIPLIIVRNIKQLGAARP